MKYYDALKDIIPNAYSQNLMDEKETVQIILNCEEN